MSGFLLLFLFRQEPEYEVHMKVHYLFIYCYSLFDLIGFVLFCFCIISNDVINVINDVITACEVIIAFCIVEYENEKYSFVVWCDVGVFFRYRKLEIMSSSSSLSFVCHFYSRNVVQTHNLTQNDDMSEAKLVEARHMASVVQQAAARTPAVREERDR